MTDSVILNAAWVVPVRPRGAVLERHSVVIEEGRIAAVLPTAEARSRYEGTREVDLDRHVLLPGLINMHTHSPMTLLRGYADDRDMQTWLREDIWPLEARFVSPEFVADGSRLAIVEMIRAGTTCFNENYFFPNAIAAAADSSGIRACIGLPIIEMSTAWAETVDECFARGINLVEAYASHSRLQFSLAPHAPYTVGNPTLDRIAKCSAERQLPVHMHLLETAWEAQQSLEQYGKSPLERLAATGLLNERLLAVHMTQLGPSEIARLARHHVNIVHCPESNLKLASGICPLIELLEAGINLCIGTDGAASNNDLDLLNEARTAALLAKGVSSDATQPEAFATLEMLTINAARALGLEETIGSIEPGKAADLVALDLDHARTLPVHDVVSAIIYSAASGQFSDVWVEGRRLMDCGSLRTLDEADVLARAVDWGRRIGPAANRTVA